LSEAAVGLRENRDLLLAKYGAYVRSLALTVRRQFHATLELEELISWGQVGLLEAAERFDPKVGANFLTFAHYRIKGAILDGLRKMGVLRGSDARAMFVGERANAYLGNLSDRESGGRNRSTSLDEDVREISTAATGLAMVFATSFDGTEGQQIADPSIPADQRLEFEQLRARVRGAIEKLPDKERKLLEGYYYRGKTLEQAGSEIGQSKSWASRLHARAIERLKDMLGEEDEKPSAQTAARRSAHGDAAVGRGAQNPPDRSAKASGAKPPRKGQTGPVDV
jgi:RNA polymerase sigma factor for flagellar operon FliA